MIREREREVGRRGVVESFTHTLRGPSCMITGYKKSQPREGGGGGGEGEGEGASN